MNRFTTTVLLLTLSQAGPTIHAQDSRTLDLYNQIVARSTFDPAGLSTVATTHDLLTTIKVIPDKTTISAEFGIYTSDRSKSGFSSSFKLSGPLNTDGDSSLSTKDGLSNAVTASLRFRLVYPNKVSSISRLTEAELEKKWRGKIDNISTADLTPTAQSSFLEDFGIKRTWFAASSIKYGAPTKFEYLDKMDLSKQKSTLESYGIEGSLGVLTKMKATHLVALTYFYEKGYESQNKQDICIPFEMTNALACSNISVGAPKKEYERALQLESHHYFRSGKYLVIPRVKHDFATGRNTYSAPFYFYIDPKNGFNIGINTTYNTDDDEIDVGLFIGAIGNPFKGPK